MAEREELAAAMVGHRKKRDRLNKSLRHLHDELMGLQRSEEFETLTYNNIQDRLRDYAGLHTRLVKQMDALEEEEDEDLNDADEVFRRDHSKMYDQASRTFSYLSAIKRVGSQLSTLEMKVIDLEQMKTEDPEKDYSACYKPLDKIAEQIHNDLEQGNILPEHELSQNARLLSKRLLEVKTTTKPEAKPAIFESMASRNIDAPKVNMPDFHGDLLSWSPFWSRFKASVHDSTKLKDSKNGSSDGQGQGPRNIRISCCC